MTAYVLYYLSIMCGLLLNFALFRRKLPFFRELYHFTLMQTFRKHLSHVLYLHICMTALFSLRNTPYEAYVSTNLTIFAPNDPQGRELRVKVDFQGHTKRFYNPC